MEFECRLKIILWERQMKQSDLCKQTGMSSAGMSLLVNNKTLPTFENAYKISEALNMPLYEIWIKKE